MSEASVNRFASKQTAFHEIPVIDVAALVDGSDPEGVARQIGDSCEKVGFFYVKNHGVPSDLVKRMYAVTEEFFALPEDVKDNVHVAKSGPTVRGYIPPSAENADQDKKTADLKEAFDYGAKQDTVAPFFGPNLMPADFPEFEATCDEYYAAMRTLARNLVSGFAISLGLEPDYFERIQTNPITIQRLLHYPPQNPDDDQAIGIGAHTDKGILTILSQDNIGGLQVQNKDGEWITAPPVEDAFVINIGDLVAKMTNGKYSSTVHRVVNESGAERYSVAFFIDLDFDAPVETLPTCVDAEHPADPNPFTCGEYKTQWFTHVYPHLRNAPEILTAHA